MKLIISATLKGKVDGTTAVWPKGSVFNDEIEPIPDDIIKELRSDSGLVQDITPVVEKVEEVKVPPPPVVLEPKVKAKPKPKAKPKVKAKPKPKAKPKAAKKKL